MHFHRQLLVTTALAIAACSPAPQEGSPCPLDDNCGATLVCDTARKECITAESKQKCRDDKRAPGAELAETIGSNAPLSKCDADGACYFRSGNCQVARAEDCATSKFACPVMGRCALAGTVCAATAEGCLRTEICHQVGMCTAVNGACEVASDDDCRKAQVCALSGACRAENGSCVAGR